MGALGWLLNLEFKGGGVVAVEPPTVVHAAELRTRRPEAVEVRGRWPEAVQARSRAPEAVEHRSGT